jgi:osmotically-inducible protein OsmY
METKRPADTEIAERVLRELEWDTRVREDEIGVQVNDGIVTLRGEVRSLQEYTAAADAAHRVAGVLDVANDLEVVVRGPESRTDLELARAVRNALEWDSVVPDDRITSTVSFGHVTLEGQVDVWTQREDAERAVRCLAGVCKVTNNIGVFPPHVVEHDIERAIRGALERQARREADRLTIAVDGGHVKLSGSVRSWREREAVLGAARGTRGVRSIESHLSIDR